MDEPRAIPVDGLVIRLSVRARVVLWLYGVLMPLICFAVTAMRGVLLIDRPWQSGTVEVYAEMLLRPSAWIPFTPWLLLSMCSLSRWAYQPLAAKDLWVRLGLYSGVVLSIQYLVVVVLCTSIFTFFATLFVLPAIFVTSLLAANAAPYFKRYQIWHLMWLMTLVAIVVALTSMLPTDHAVEFVVFALFFALAAFPTLNLIAYLRAAWIVSSIDRAGLRQPYRLLAMFAGWTLGWLVSWRFAVQAMLDEYSRLPVSNPNCYFANAAANAHVWLGGSRQRPDSFQMRSTSINVPTSKPTLAMKRLKFIELALFATAPHLHRFIRCYYDRWGEPAARYCSQHCWFANLTCLALKPVEALAEIVRAIAGVSRARLAAIYESGLSFSASSATSAVKCFSTAEDAEGAGRV